MPNRRRRAARIVMFGAGGLALLAALVLAWLTFPQTPSGAKSLRFAGYISLPNGGGFRLLTVLDYLSIDGGHLFVTNVSTGSVYRIALDHGKLPAPGDISVIDVGRAPHGVAVDPKSGFAFVTRSGVNSVDVFDPADRKVVARIPVADGPDAILYDSGHRLVYAASGDAGQGTFIDPATRRAVGALALGGKPEFVVYDAHTNLLYQNIEDANAVVAIDPATRAIVHRWAFPQCLKPTGIAIDESANRLFIVCGGSSTLMIVDIDRHEAVASLPIGKGPDAVAFDPVLRRIYSTGLAGDLAVVQQDSPDRYRQLDRVHLHFGAHTLAVDPATHNVYAGYASFFIAPRLAMFNAVP